MAFAQSYNVPSRIAVYATAAGMMEASYGSENQSGYHHHRANPDYFPVNALNCPRTSFSTYEMSSSGFVTVIGYGLMSLFGDQDPIGEFLNVDGRRYQVIGVLKSKGAAFWRRADKQIFIPLGNARSVYGGDDMNFQIKYSLWKDRIVKMLMKKPRFFSVLCSAFLLQMKPISV